MTVFLMFIQVRSKIPMSSQVLTDLHVLPFHPQFYLFDEPSRPATPLFLLETLLELSIDCVSASTRVA